MEEDSDKNQIVKDMNLDDAIYTCLRHVYKQHEEEHVTRSCNLERNLPLKDPYFILKRVPHFRVRTDLHTNRNPAYIPLVRLEAASIDDLIDPMPNGCRKILLEGDIGVGKTTLCYNVLHRWEKFQTDSQESRNIIVYIDCSTIQPIDCTSCLVTNTLIGYLKQEGVDVSYQDVFDWLEMNGNDVDVIFDNVTNSPEVKKQIVSTINIPNMLFSRITVFSSPGVMEKDLFDSLYYCYGIKPEYSNKILLRQLRKASDKPEEKLTLLHKLDCQQEFNRNPLSLSSVISYLNSVENGNTPRHKYDLLRGIVRMAIPETLQRRAETNISVDIQHCTDILAQKAFNSMSDQDHYLCMDSFPPWFRGLHLCDFCFVHNIHGPMKSSTMFAFTSRCFRDFFAVQHAVTLLKTESESEAILQRLMNEKMFLPLLSLCCRQLKLCGQEELLHRMFRAMIQEVQKRFVTCNILTTDHNITKGMLRHFGRILNCLHEVDFQPQFCDHVARSFPNILEFSFQDCSKRTIEDLTGLITYISNKQTFRTSGIVLHLDGMFNGRSEPMGLARALNEMTSLTTLMVSAICIPETRVLVEFLCDIFRQNSHILNLTIRGPMNSVHNLTADNHRKVRSVFQKGIALKSLTIENFQHQHKAAYAIRCWPAIFDKLEIQKCNLEASTPDILDKMRQSANLVLMCIDFCYILPSKLCVILKNLIPIKTIRVLHLNTLSAKRKFNSSDVNKPHFRYSMTPEVCAFLTTLLESSESLKEIELCQNGLGKNAGVILDAAVRCGSLTHLDMTGNAIGDDVIDNVVTLIAARNLKRLILGSNSFSAEGRKRIIEVSINQLDLQLSL